MIDVEHVSYSYSKMKTVLKDIVFQQDKGHCLALLGNNGAGKSTLLNCLNKIVPAGGGTIRVCGQDLRNMTRDEIARNMAYVAQHTEVSQLTVYDSVLIGRKPYTSVRPEKEDFEIVEETLKRLNLESFSLRYIDELSGGELQKVVLARALAQKPNVLLLDEPTSNLDLFNQHEVMQLAADIAKDDGILVIVVLHDLNLALRYCDRFLLIKDGSVYSYGDHEIITEKAISDIFNVSASIITVNGQKLIVV